MKHLSKKIPINVNNLLIKDYIDFELLKQTDADTLKLCSYFTEHPVSYFEELSFNELERFLFRLRLLLNSKPNVKRKEIVKVNGIRYRAAKTEKDFRTNQYTAYSEYNKAPIKNLHKKLAVIYTDTKLFKPYEFNDSNVNERANNILNYGKVGDFIGNVFFFNNLFEGLSLISQTSFLIANLQIKELLAEIAQEEQDLESSTDGISLSIQSQAATLLEKMNLCDGILDGSYQEYNTLNTN